MDLLQNYAASSSEDAVSSSSGSESSCDSATKRAREAASKVKDFGDLQGDAGPQGLLPGVDSAFGEVAGPPKFLDPEATRRRKVCLAHLKAHDTAAPVAGSAAGAGQNTANSDAGFDVSKLAPRLKGTQASKDVRQAVLTAPAKRAREAPSTNKAAAPSNAALVAMMGGTLGPAAEMQESDEVPDKPAKKPSKAMDIQDFLAQGPGAQLPRRKQERKDKEKNKRAKGQSSHNVWKSEAEMALRQQYD